MTRHARSVAWSGDPLERLEVSSPRRGSPGERETASLVLVRRGALALRSAAGEHVADPCTAVLVWQQAPIDPGGDHLVIELGPHAPRRPPHRDLAVSLSPRLQLAVAELAATLRWHAQPEVAQAARALVDAILDAAPAEGRVSSAGGQPRRLALAAVLALHRDLSINRSISELAEEVGCSPFYLMHAFRDEIGDTIRAYRLRARLGVALHRLADGDDDLTALAMELGFASHSHFTDTFTRELGLSPSRLRARLQLLSARRAAGW